MGHVSVTVSYLCHCVTTKTEKHVSENSSIVKSVVLKYYIYEQRGEMQKEDA